MKKLLILILISVSLYGFGQRPQTNITFVWSGGYNISGADTLMRDSLTGAGDPQYKLTFCADQLTNLTAGYIDCKSLCRINGRPITTIFQNTDFADTSFYKFSNQVLNIDSTENLPYRLVSVARYSTAVTGDDKVWNYDFYEVPFIVNEAMETVCASGCDHTTIEAAYSAAATNDSVIVFSGNYNISSTLTCNKDVDIIGVGNCYVTASGTNQVILFNTSTTENFISGLKINGEARTSYTIYGSGATSNKTIKNCHVTGATQYCLRFATTVGGKYHVNNSVIIGTGSSYNCLSAAETNINGGCGLVTNPYIVGAGTGKLDIKYFRFISKRSTNYCVQGAVDRFLSVKYCKFDVTTQVSSIYSSPTAALTNNILIKGNTFNITASSGAVIDFVNDSYQKIYIQKNVFNNVNSAAVTDISIANFSVAKIEENVFNSLSGVTIPISVKSTALADTLLITNNASYQSNESTAYNIRIGTESTAATDNKIKYIRISENLARGPKFYNVSSTNSAHGTFLGFTGGANCHINHNFINGYGIGLVLKGSNNNYSNYYIYNDIYTNNHFYGIYSKGVGTIKFYNLTLNKNGYNFYFSSNTGGDPADSCIIRNCISNLAVDTGYHYYFANDSSHRGVSIDYNQTFGGTRTAYYKGAYKFWNEWKTLGFDANSFNSTPNFKSSTELWPISGDAFGHGKDLGSSYNHPLNTNSVWPNLVNERPFVSTWNIGAYNSDAPIPIVGNSGSHHFFILVNGKLLVY